MGYLLKQINKDDEFDDLIVAFRKGFIDPGDAIWPLYTADIKPYDEEYVQVVLKECAGRFAEWHHHDPTSVWLKVVDEKSGEIVAGGRWSIFKKDGGNPYDNHGHYEATWFPEGNLRVVATKLINDFLASACKHANYPHAFLNILFTVPEYRRTGAASMIMDWGMAQAKENGLDTFIEASSEGKPLYLKYGFHAIEEQSLSLGDLESMVEDDPALKKIVYENLLPIKWTSMLKRAE